MKKLIENLKLITEAEESRVKRIEGIINGLIKEVDYTNIMNYDELIIDTVKNIPYTIYINSFKDEVDDYDALMNLSKDIVTAVNNLTNSELKDYERAYFRIVEEIFDEIRQKLELKYNGLEKDQEALYNFYMKGDTKFVRGSFYDYKENEMYAWDDFTGLTESKETSRKRKINESLKRKSLRENNENLKKVYLIEVTSWRDYEIVNTYSELFQTKKDAERMFSILTDEKFQQQQFESDTRYNLEQASTRVELYECLVEGEVDFNRPYIEEEIKNIIKERKYIEGYIIVDLMPVYWTKVKERGLEESPLTESTHPKKKWLVWSHSDPDDLWEVSSFTKEEEDYVKDLDNWKEVTNIEGLWLVGHTDEDMVIYKPTGSTIEEVKENMIKEIQSLINKGEYEELEDHEWESLDSFHYSLPELTSPEQIVGEFFEWVEQTEVDGDSNYKWEFKFFNKNEDYESVTSFFEIEDAEDLNESLLLEKIPYDLAQAYKRSRWWGSNASHDIKHRRGASYDYEKAEELEKEPVQEKLSLREKQNQENIYAIWDKNTTLDTIKLVRASENNILNRIRREKAYDIGHCKANEYFWPSPSLYLVANDYYKVYIHQVEGDTVEEVKKNLINELEYAYPFEQGDRLELYTLGNAPFTLDGYDVENWEAKNAANYIMNGIKDSDIDKNPYKLFFIELSEKDIINLSEYKGTLKELMK